MKHWPTIIIEDRYMGTYSGGLWVAFYGYKNLDIIGDGPHADDVSARNFDYTQDWLAVGNTPQEALDNLIKKQS